MTFMSGSLARASSGWERAEEVDQLFAHLVTEWKQETRFTSSMSDLVTHPAYQRIIGLGPAALPLIFGELRRAPGHWFWALKAITGEDPVPASARGNLSEMTKAWLRWAAEHGLSSSQ